MFTLTEVISISARFFRTRNSGEDGRRFVRREQQLSRTWLHNFRAAMVPRSCPTNPPQALTRRAVTGRRALMAFVVTKNVARDECPWWWRIAALRDRRTDTATGLTP